MTWRWQQKTFPLLLQILRPENLSATAGKVSDRLTTTQNTQNSSVQLLFFCQKHFGHQLVRRLRHSFKIEKKYDRKSWSKCIHRQWLRYVSGENGFRRGRRRRRGSTVDLEFDENRLLWLTMSPCTFSFSQSGQLPVRVQTNWKKYRNYDLKVDKDQDDKAKEIKLTSTAKPHMRAFHGTK